jgi:preprotein translocase subunit SecA
MPLMFGTLRQRWILARARRQLRHIERHGQQCAGLSDDELRTRSLALRYRARCGEALSRLLPEAYALVREAAGRRLGMRHYAVQLLGGIVLQGGAVAEMQTGEGKTLTATLPLYLNALAGRGAHLVTHNDYLARRDAEWMEPVFGLLGLTVGCVTSDTPDAARRRAYACDITYSDAKQLGFDFLRDRLLRRVHWLGDAPRRLRADAAPPGAAAPLQREPFFALVDEADSILIDDARTPLIISALGTQEPEAVQASYRWAAQLAQRLVPGEHFVRDPATREVLLTVAGRSAVRSSPTPAAMATVDLPTLYHFVQRAIVVQHDFVRDRHYVIDQRRIVLIDESTGRPAQGRRWRDGIHQALEAKEGLAVTVDAGHAAQITVQELFARYPRLSGMTGTALPAAAELFRSYRLRVVPIPTHRRVQRREEPCRIFRTAEEKWTAVVDEVACLHAQGRPVLIGTRSIEQSELVSQRLTARGIAHHVLNARHLAAEAQIVAQAGQRGAVTVATNMAGRGTDIRLGPGVAEMGGLHVVCTEMHDSARIDRQLIGRCARQGDPGSFRQYVSLQDELLREAYGAESAARLLRKYASGTGSLAPRWLRRFRAAQRRVQRRHERQRRQLMYFTRLHRRRQQQLGVDPYVDDPGL